MTPHEKAVNAINARLERLQANLREATVETSQRYMFQSLVVAVGVAEELTDYVKMVGTYAQRRHAEVKQTNETLAAKHDELLKSGKELLEKLKANPTDQSIRKEIEAMQQQMAAVQKTLRRDTNALQRELAPSLAMIDELAVSVRRFGEADQGDALKRLLKTVIEQVRDLYAAHPGIPGKGLVDVAAWTDSAASEIDQAADFYDSFARAGFQVMLALEWMTMAVSANPPSTGAEATERANEAVASRLKQITARITAA